MIELEHSAQQHGNKRRAYVSYNLSPLRCTYAHALKRMQAAGRLLQCVSKTSVETFTSEDVHFASHPEKFALYNQVDAMPALWQEGVDNHAFSLLHEIFVLLSQVCLHRLLLPLAHYHINIPACQQCIGIAAVSSWERSSGSVLRIVRRRWSAFCLKILPLAVACSARPG